MSSITHWRLYLAAHVGEQNHSFVEISETAAKQLRERMAEDHTIIPFAVVTGREPNVRSSRTLYVNPSQVIALEPRDD